MSPPVPSKLDERQVLQSVHDVDRGTLRVDATVHLNGSDPLGDNVAIVDPATGNKLSVNTDGSINVVVTSGGTPIPKIGKNIFNEQLAVASGSTVNLVTYTVPVAKIMVLERIYVSGDNIAKYYIYLNGAPFDLGRTSFAELNTDFIYSSTEQGYKLIAGDIVLVTVNNFRPDVSDFSGRIQLTEVG